MKKLNKNIVLLLTGIFMFSMPMTAQNSSTHNESEILQRIQKRFPQRDKGGRWIIKSVSIEQNRPVIYAIYYPDGINMDSIELVIMMNPDERDLDKSYALTEKGKYSVNEYINKVESQIEKLANVFNTKEITDPTNNLDKNYNLDFIHLDNLVCSVDNLVFDIPQADNIYKIDPDFSEKIKIGKNLCALYEILDTNYTNPYNNFHLRSSSYMEEKAEDATKILDALMSNPLFPKKSQATVNVVKTKLKSMTNSYAQAWSNANKTESAKREAQNTQNRKIDELVESYDIPKIVNCEKKYDFNLGWYYAYSFGDGTGGIIYIQKGTSFYMVDTGGRLNTAYKTLREAECALYFYQKYGKERKTGKVGY